MLDGDGHTGVGLDVADTEAVAAALGKVAVDVGPVATLINVAGWDRFVPFVDTTPEFWDRVIDINYRGTLNTVHAVLPGMIERQRGRIVSVASDAARVGSSLESIYAGAKGAVISFSKSVAREVARYGITVNVVCPGPTDTPLIRSDGRRARLGRAVRRRADEGDPDAAPGDCRRRRAGDRVPRLRRRRVHHRPDIVGQRRADDGLRREETSDELRRDGRALYGWTEAADLARRVEAAGFSGMVFTETGQTPWMSIAAAAAAAPTLMFSTGIAVAFPVSPMVAASIAWELAGNTRRPVPARSGQPGEGAHRTALRQCRSIRPVRACGTTCWR